MQTTWSREDLAWMAGLYEGEGCVSTNRRKLTMKIGMTDRDVLEDFQRRAGGGYIYGPYDKGGLSKKPSFDYVLTGRRAYALYVAIWPWLKERRHEQVKRGVGAWLTATGLRKLDGGQVREIRERYGPYVRNKHGRVSLVSLAAEFGVSVSLVQQIVSGNARVGVPA